MSFVGFVFSALITSGARPITSHIDCGRLTLIQDDRSSVSLSAERGIAINGGVTATIDTQGDAMAIGGAVGGSGGLAKVGTGTTIQGGTLVFNSAGAIGGTGPS